MRHLVLALLLSAAPFVAQADQHAAKTAKFSLSSADVKPGSKIADAHVFKGFGCEGGNLSPALEWKNAPAGTKSFALTVYDPDAPTGSGWWHWVVFNMPADTTAIAQGATPPGVQGRTDFGATGYGGPCPPVGDKPHRYIFTIHALKIEKLEGLDANSPAAMVGYMINANRLAKAQFTAKYGR